MSVVSIHLRRMVLMLVLAAFGILVLAGPVMAKTLSPVAVLEANLTGAQEVPGPGDRNGSGDATLVVSPKKVCYVLTADDIRRPVAAHIHRGSRGVAGPIVVELNTPNRGSQLTGFFSGGCERISPALSKALREHPSRYYVNVHNNPFPDGAIRGQLHR